MEDAVDVDAIAKLLGVSADTVYTLARTGEIPAVKVGRRWRFWPTAVREHLERQIAERDLWARPERRKAFREVQRRG